MITYVSILQIQYQDKVEVNFSFMDRFQIAKKMFENEILIYNINLASTFLLNNYNIKLKI